MSIQAHSGLFRMCLELPDQAGNWTERPFQVYYEYTPGCRGLREAGRRIEPDYAPELDITGVIDAMNKDWYGVVSEQGKLEEVERQIWEWLHLENVF